MSSKATLALFIYGIIMHYSVSSSPVGLSFPSIRYVYSYLSLSCTFLVADFSFTSSILRAQANDLICFTVSYVCEHNSRLDYRITSSDSQSIGLRNIHQGAAVMKFRLLRQ